MKQTIFAAGLVFGLLAITVDLRAQFGALRKRAEQAVKSGVDKATSQPKEAPKPSTAPEAAQPAKAEPAKAPEADTAKTQPPAAPASPAAPSAKPAPAVQAEVKPEKPPLEKELDQIDSHAQRLVYSDSPLYFSRAVVAAARALDEQARVAFTQRALTALKALVESDAFAKRYEEDIRGRHKAVNHGIKAFSDSEYQAKGDRAGLEAFQKRRGLSNIVLDYEKRTAENIQFLLKMIDLDTWSQYVTAYKDQPKKRALYQKLIEDGRALQNETDLTKLRRGYAVLKATELSGDPITAEALYAIPAAFEKEEQQANWNDHNLKVVTKRVLTSYVALVPTVDFNAATREEKGKTKFVRADYERKPALWKMIFRAGKGPADAGLAFAQAWLKQL